MRPLGPRGPTGPKGATDVRQLQNKVTELERRLAALLKAVQIDPGGQSLTLKVPANITIDAGSHVEVKAGAAMTLVGARIDLN